MKKKIGIFTLAITLISLGILFLLNNFLEIDGYKIMSIMWPCIIILFGLEMIIIRQVYKKKDEDVNVTVDTLSMILLIIIVLTFSIVSNIRIAISKVDFLSDGFQISPNFNVIYKYTSDFSKNFEFEGTEKDKLILYNSFGNIEIYKSDSDKVEVSATIRIKHNNEELAEDISNKIIKVDDTGRTLRIVSNTDGFKYDNDRVKDIIINYYIKVPTNISVDVENSFGKITVDGIEKDTSIKNSFGDIKIKSINGQLDVENSFGNIDVINIEGDSIINNKYGNIDVNNIKGDLNLSNSFGSIEIFEVSEFVKIVSKSGDISLITTDRVKKGLDVDNEFGDINISLPLEQEGNFIVGTSFGKISNELGLNVDEALNEQTIRDNIGNSEVMINIRNSHGNIDIDVN